MGKTVDVSDIKDSPVSTEKTPDISIVIPVFNAEEYLEDCLKSVLAQTFQNFEVILVDDGSRDSSGKICDEFSLGDPRFRTFHIANSGPAAARNHGLNRILGQTIFFLDADDWLPEDSLEVLFKGYAETKADIILGEFCRVSESGVQEFVMGLPEERLLLDETGILAEAVRYLNASNRNLAFAFSWGRLLKSSVVLENHLRFEETLHTFEDVSFNFEFLKYANSMLMLKHTVYRHRIHSHFRSMSMQLSRDFDQLLAHLKMLEKAKDYLRCKNRSEYLNEAEHCLVNLSIILMVRLCCSLNVRNFIYVYGSIAKLLYRPEMKQAIPYYKCPEGGSRILPMLMRRRWIVLILVVCKYKARKRYVKKGK